MEPKISGKDLAGYLAAADTAAHQAGRIIMDGFRRKHQVKSKGPSNLVTEIDLAAEEVVIAALTGRYPGIPVVSEEADSLLIKDGWCWIVDPLDGTTNYVYGVPFFCVNIALVFNAKLQIAVTYDPVHEEVFSAQMDRGACLNGSPIRVSARESLDSAVVGSDIGYNLGKGRETLDLSKDLRENVHCLRFMGSAALGIAYVACGRFDIYYHRFLYPWDIAAGILLVKEAGGRVFDWNWDEAGVASREIIATNGRLDASFRAAIFSKG